MRGWIPMRSALRPAGLSPISGDVPTVRIRQRLADYALLLAISAALTLPNLGASSFWDVDEGVNAEAAREMREAGTWVIPTFNFELRTAKPVMLYWLQRASYAAFGVSEWSARLPSVLCGWLTVLLVYELGRRMFSRGTGLLSALVLASAIEFCMLIHAATPDATLLLFTVFSFYLFWIGQENGGRGWWLPTAAACGLAMLTKGPVGVALPGLVILLYFGWNRELGRLCDRRFLWATLVFAAVAGPWYGLVAAETRGQWVKAFFLHENVNRALTPMEEHSGPFFFHAAALLVLFAPWSVFLISSVWHGVKEARTPEQTEHRASRFLICWFAGYLIFFSLVRTKLPNYVLPLYPAIAILTARFLVRWREGVETRRRWMMPASLVGMVLLGLVFVIGLLALGGVIPIPTMRTFAGMDRWAILGAVPLVGAAFMRRFLQSGDRAAFVTTATASALVFVGLVAAFPPVAMDAYKAPRELVRTSGVGDLSRDLRVAAFDWFQPSVVFYSQREVEKLQAPDKVVEFLAIPTPGYLFIAEPVWTAWFASQVPKYRIAARHFDFYSNCDVLVITNELEKAGGGPGK